MRKIESFPDRLIIATGNHQKARAYEQYPFPYIDTLDPETDCGVEESLSSDPKEVAWQKSNIVVATLLDLWPSQNNFVVTGNDVAAFFSTTFEGLFNSFQRKELKKLMRYISKLTTDRERQNFLARKQEETLVMYCNGQFHFRWIVGFSIQVPKTDLNITGEVDIVGVFNPLAESLVIQSFQDNSALHMSPRVPLALVLDLYAHKLFRREEDGLQPIDNATVYSLVVNGVLPYSSFEDLVLNREILGKTKNYIIKPIHLSTGEKHDIA